MSHHTVALSGMPSISLRLPSFEDIERAARRRDAAALSDLDRRCREAMPTGETVDVELIYAAHDRLVRISEELRKLSGVGLSDHGDERARARRQHLGGTVAPDETLPARLAAARQALDGAREGRQPDADVKARADGVRRDLEGGA